MTTTRFSRGRIFLVVLVFGIYISLAGCSSDSTPTSEHTRPGDVKAETKARNENADVESRIKSKNIKTH
jgi:hypothetical protein